MVLELAGQTCNISERIETNKYVTRKNPTDLEDAEQEAKEPSLKSSRKMTTAIAQGTQKSQSLKSPRGALTHKKLLHADNAHPNAHIFLLVRARNIVRLQGEPHRNREPSALAVPIFILELEHCQLDLSRRREIFGVAVTRHEGAGAVVEDAPVFILKPEVLNFRKF